MEGGRGGDIKAKTEPTTLAISQSFELETSEPLRLLRNSILEAEPYIVYQGYALGRCLDQCLYRDTHL